jgi:hypothetical protein
MSRSADRSESAPLYYILAAVALIAIVMLLIEWNARRQAAAMTRELLRPATPEEQLQLEAAVAELVPAEPTEAENAALLRQVWGEDEPRAQRAQPAPLAAGERCISGQRFRRLPNGWEEIGTC